MARINIVGAESGSSTGDPGATLTTNASVQSTVKRTGAYAFRVNATGANTGYVQLVGASGAEFNLATAYYRFYFRYATKLAANDEAIFWATNSGGGTIKMQVRLHSDGKLRAYKFSGGIGLIGTGTTTLSADTWYRIDVQVGTGNPSSWEVKIDGTTEMSGSHDLQTANSARCRLGKDPASTNSQDVDFFYDDIAIDDAGFPGPGEVKVLKPDGDGAYTAWTGDWNDVKQLPHDDTTTMITTSTNTNAESVTVENTSTAGISGTVKAVVALAVAREVGGGTVDVAVRLRSGTTDSDSANLTLPSSFGGLGHIRETDPATSAAWTLSGVDGIQVGIVHKQAQSRQADCTALYAMVEYEPAAGGGAFELNAEPGSYLITGAPMTPLADRLINAEPGSYLVSGAAAGVLAGRMINAEPGSYGVNGAAAVLLADRLINAAPGTYEITGAPAQVGRELSLNAEPGSYAIDGAAASLLADRLINTDPGSYAIDGAAASLLADRLIHAEPGSYSVTGAPATLAKGYVVVAEAGSYIVSGAAAGLLADRVLNAESGAIIVSGAAAGLFADRVLNAEPGAFIITGAAATLLADRLLNLEPGSYQIVGADADLVFTSVSAYELNCEPGVYLITGAAASLLADRVMNAEPGEYDVVGFLAALEHATGLTLSLNGVVPCFETDSGPNVVECYETTGRHVPVRITSQGPHVVPIHIGSQGPHRVPIKRYQ